MIAASVASSSSSTSHRRSTAARLARIAIICPISVTVAVRAAGNATPAAIRVAPTAKAITIVVPMPGSNLTSRQETPVTSRIGMKPPIERTRLGSRASMSAA